MYLKKPLRRSRLDGIDGVDVEIGGLHQDFAVGCLDGQVGQLLDVFVGCLAPPRNAVEVVVLIISLDYEPPLIRDRAEMATRNCR